MKIKSQRDFLSGLMFLVVGIVFAVGATNYSWGSSARPGAGYFPLILSVIMAILGAVVLFKALTIETEGGDPIGDIAWRPLILVVASVAVFGALLPKSGLYVAAGASIAIALVADRETSPFAAIAGAVLGTLVAVCLVEFVAPLLQQIFFGAILWIGKLLNILTFGMANRLASMLLYVAQVAARIVPLALLVFVLRKVPGSAKPIATVTVLFTVLIAMSVWVFVQGLGLTIPLQPSLNLTGG